MSRLREMRKTLGLTQEDVASIIGISRSTYTGIEQGKAPLTDRNKMLILDKLHINPIWFDSGLGEPLIAPDALKIMKDIQSECSEEIQAAERKQGVPYYENIEGTCGIIPQFSDYSEVPTFYIDYEHFNDCTAYIPVVGDSMYPQYCSGEIIAVKRIYNMDVIQWGEAYFVVTNDNANGLKTVKQIHWCDDDSKIILRASNPNFRGDTVINKVDIISLFIIKGKIKRNQL